MFKTRDRAAQRLAHASVFFDQAAYGARLTSLAYPSLAPGRQEAFALACLELTGYGVRLDLHPGQVAPIPDAVPTVYLYTNCAAQATAWAERARVGGYEGVDVAPPLYEAPENFLPASRADQVLVAMVRAGIVPDAAAYQNLVNNGALYQARREVCRAVWELNASHITGGRDARLADLERTWQTLFQLRPDDALYVSNKGQGLRSLPCTAQDAAELIRMHLALITRA